MKWLTQLIFVLALFFFACDCSPTNGQNTRPSEEQPSVSQVSNHDEPNQPEKASSRTFFPFSGLFAQQYQDNHRVVGGLDAQEGQFPYQVSLQEASRSRHFCGGAIYNANFIITAAHCCDAARYMRRVEAVVGTSNLSNESSTVQRLEVLKTTNYPTYMQFFSSANDLCMMELRTPMTLTAAVSPVMMPTRDTEPSTVYKGLVSGWGLTDGFASRIPPRLQYANLPVVSDEDCLSQATFVNALARPVFTDICAGGDGKSACMGDSGGPLVQSGVLIGIVSRGPKDCSPDTPTIFTQVSHYVDWMQTVAATSQSIF